MNHPRNTTSSALRRGPKRPVGPNMLDLVLETSASMLLHGHGPVDAVLHRLRRRLSTEPIDLRGANNGAAVRAKVAARLEASTDLLLLLGPTVSGPVRTVLSNLLDGRAPNAAGGVRPADKLRVIAVSSELPEEAVVSMFPLTMATPAALRISRAAAARG